MLREIKPGQTHRDVYPEQYTHPLVGARVRVKTHAGVQGEGEVIRVFVVLNVQLAEVKGVGRATTAWHVSDCTRIA